MDDNVILKTENLKKSFPVKRGLLKREVASIKAVDGVSIYLEKGHTLGLVGESGCGKSTLAKLLVGLLKPDSGSIDSRVGRKGLQLVFQDPFSSLDPRFNVFQIIEEGLGNFLPEKDPMPLVKDILELVALPQDCLRRFPHEFSAGQRQRISLARSLVLNPEILILDEPVSSLDVSVQSQIINLLLDLQKKLNLTYLFISHDLGVVRALSDRIAVMYNSRIVEEAGTEELFNNPRHSYTRVLLAAASGGQAK